MPETVTANVEGVREVAGSYNVATLHDAIVKVRVKALSFLPNLNGFMFKRDVLERMHTNAFGETIPAYKSFERQLCNWNHWATDNNKPANKTIGYIERSELHDDGVYLDLIVWKRMLTDSELAQLKSGKAACSMEVEFTDPVIRTQSGAEERLMPGTPLPPGAVRTMSSTSVVSFIGIALLFDGVKPADPRSGVVYVENAALNEVCRTTEVAAINSVSEKNEGEKQMDENALQGELAELQRQLAELQSAREKASEDIQALNDQFAAKNAELAAKQAELQKALTDLDTASAELYALRNRVFTANLEAIFDMAAMSPDVAEWVTNEFRCACFGNEDANSYMVMAAMIFAAAKAMKIEPSMPAMGSENASVEGTEGAANTEGGAAEGTGTENTETPAPATTETAEVAPEAVTETAEAEEPAPEMPAPGVSLGGDPAAPTKFNRQYLR